MCIGVVAASIRSVGKENREMGMERMEGRRKGRKWNIDEMKGEN